MSETPDPLEAELSALRPHEVSPGLRWRIANRLADPSPVKHRRWGRIALAAGLTAACLAAVLLLWRGGKGVDPEPIVVRPQPAPPFKVDDSRPTLLAYQRALARSPEDLDALLARGAVVAPQTHPELVTIRAFTRSEATLDALLGED